MRPLALVALLAAAAGAQESYFTGAMAGVSTLSADARSVVAGPGFAVAMYKPENGPALHLFGGRHLSDWISLQGNYVWNRNDIALEEFRSNGAYFRSTLAASQHSVSGDLMVYFRGRPSRLRPYLAFGLAAVHFPDSTAAAVRFAVGIDLRLRRGWALRYSFAETIRGNPVSARLDPRGQRNLANFQNLVGVVKHFR